MNDISAGRGHGTPAATIDDEDPRPSEYDHRGDAERTAIVEEDAAEWAGYVAEYEAEAATERAESKGGDADPGPVPAVVEPELPPTTTIPVTPQTHLEITRRDGYTRLALVSVRAGARVATDMPPQAVDALVCALVAHTPPPYVLAGGSGSVA